MWIDRRDFRLGVRWVVATQRRVSVFWSRCGGGSTHPVILTRVLSWSTSTSIYTYSEYFRKRREYTPQSIPHPQPKVSTQKEDGTATFTSTSSLFSSLRGFILSSLLSPLSSLLSPLSSLRPLSTTPSIRIRFGKPDSEHDSLRRSRYSRDETLEFQGVERPQKTWGKIPDPRVRPPTTAPTRVEYRRNRRSGSRTLKNRP